MTDDSYDVVVIGAGPGGYVCAIRAAQLGMRVACVDRRGRFGGTCLNIGCIPSKALLHSSELFAEARDGLNAYGIKVPHVELDLGAMQDQKAKVVKELTQGIEFLFRKNKVTSIKGTARLEGSGRVGVELSAGGSQQLNARNILIATGSEVGLAMDAARILDGEGIGVRVVSMPCTQVFDAQSPEWREGVLPSWCRARVAVEAGITDFWRKYVGLDGAVIGIDRFGASAPAEKLFPYFGFTVDKVVAAARAQLRR